MLSAAPAAPGPAVQRREPRQ